MQLNLDTIIMIIYIFGMFCLGIYCVKYIKCYDDFFVAGRRLGFWLSIGTLMSIFVGGIAIAAIGMGHQYGLSSIWLYVSYVLGFLVLAWTFLKPLRRLEQYTIADIFDLRFGKQCRLAASIIIFISWTFVFAALVVAGARVIEVSLGWSIAVAIIATAGVFTIYTSIAGMWAVTITDFFQFLLLILGFAVLFPVAMFKVGGFSGLFSQLPPTHLSFIPNIDGNILTGLGVVWGIFLLTTPTTLVGPDVYLRIWCMKDDATARKSLYALSGGLVIIAFVIALLGMCAYVIAPNAPHEQALPLIIKELLPVGISGIVMVALLSAAVSCAVPEVVVCSSIIVRDIYQSYINPNANQKKLLKVSRTTTLGVGLLGMAIALWIPGILDLIWISYRIFVPAAVPQIIAAFYSKKTSGTAAFWSMLTGPITAVTISIIWPQTMNTWYEPVVPGIVVAFLTMFIINQFVSPSESQLKFYEQIKDKAKANTSEAENFITY